ncbi:MAG: amino acid transporter, partial [Salinivenus sp.]
VTLLALRRRNPPWYDPAFRCPGYPAVPVVGALASFALLAFMQPLLQLLGVFLSIGAVAWYGFYARGTNLRGKR